MNKKNKSLACNFLVLIGFILLTLCASGTAVFVRTDGWYAELVKPSWNPPGWVFGPVWTTLYILMALSAWLVWLKGGWKEQRKPLTLYLVQLVLNILWTPLFFGLHRPDLAFAEILLLLIAIVVTLIAFWKVKRVSGIMLLPYALWTTFAAVLNFTIWKINI